MTKPADSQQIFAEIQYFLDAGKFQDAKVLLNFVDYDPLDRESRLHALLINATIDGAAAHQAEIDELVDLAEPSAKEKEILEKLVRLRPQPQPETNRKDLPLEQQPHRKPMDRAQSGAIFPREAGETTEHHHGQEGELRARRQIVGSNESDDRTIRKLQNDLEQKSQLLQSKEVSLTELDYRYREKVSFFEKQLREKDTLIESRIGELQASSTEINRLTAQLAELNGSNDRALQTLQDLLSKQAALDALENRYRESVSSLENQLREKDAVIERGNSECQRLGVDVHRLTTQLAELGEAKDQDIARLRTDIAQQTESSRAKDQVIKEIEQGYASQIDALEIQLGEKQNLLQSFNVEIAALKNNVIALTEVRAELLCQREQSERQVVDELDEKAALLQATAAAIEELERLASANIASLERRLNERQLELHESSAESIELRRQINDLTERLAIAEAEQRSTAQALHDERAQARQDLRDPEVAQARGARAPRPPVEPLNRMAIAAPVFNDDWLNELRRVWHGRWQTKSIPTSALPMAGGVLLLIPIGYLLFAQARTTVAPAPASSWQRTLRSDAPDSATSPGDDSTPSETVTTQNRNGPKQQARPEPTASYVTRRGVPLREWPRYSATAKAQIGAGTLISVLETQGNWLKVKTRSTGETGYVRKEYLMPQNSTRY